MTTEKESVEDGQMTLVEHLTELRSRLMKAVLAVVVGAVVCYIFYPQILDVLINPYCDVVADEAVQEAALQSGAPGQTCGLLVLDPLEPFNVRLTVAGYGGLAFAMPIVLWQLWRFIQPGLYPHERRYASAFVALGAFLFALGAALAYWSIPRALSFLSTIGGDNLVSFFSPARYIGFVVKMMIAFGIGFEFPILLIFLQLAGIVENKTLRKNRHYAIVGIVVLVAIITPSGDPFTLIVLAGPMYLFYEAAILFGVIRERRLRKQQTVTGVEPA